VVVNKNKYITLPTYIYDTTHSYLSEVAVRTTYKPTYTPKV